jgi:hypothetical protein
VSGQNVWAKRYKKRAEKRSAYASGTTTSAFRTERDMRREARRARVAEADKSPAAV